LAVRDKNRETTIASSQCRIQTGTEPEPSPRAAAQSGDVHSSGGSRADHGGESEAARPHVEKLITLGKKGDLHSRRQALAFLQTGEAVTRLFDTVAPRYGDRNGGLPAHYSRRIPAR